MNLKVEFNCFCFNSSFFCFSLVDFWIESRCFSCDSSFWVWFWSDDWILPKEVWRFYYFWERDIIVEYWYLRVLKDFRICWIRDSASSISIEICKREWNLRECGEREREWGKLRIIFWGILIFFIERAKFNFWGKRVFFFYQKGL